VWAGELRLQRDGNRWVLHVTVNFEIEPNQSTGVRARMTIWLLSDSTWVSRNSWWTVPSETTPRLIRCSWMVVASDTSEKNKPALKTG
jgi:hypothetical protein